MMIDDPTGCLTCGINPPPRSSCDYGHHAPLKLRSLNHISRVCNDVNETAEFYIRLLGFRRVKRPGDLCKQ